MKQHEFILHYDGLCVKKVNAETTNEPVEVNDDVGSSADAPTLTTDEKLMKIIDKTQENELSAIVSCKMPKTKSEVVSAKFWPDVLWRQQLCTCVKCLKMYENEKVLFLIEAQDTVQIYEERGTAQALEDQQKKEEKLLNSLDRVPLMETIAAYNDLKDQLGEFLKKFAENKKVVREEDVKEFFEGMKARKRMKTEVPHFCR